MSETVDIDQAESATKVARGFEQVEYEIRTAQLQAELHEHKIDGVLLTTECDIRYYSGFYTPMWYSPTRPWFLLIPASGKPIAVVPEIGASIMQATWLDDIKTWPAPMPSDDGVSLLASTIASLSSQYGRLGMCLGAESYVRMPQNNFQTLRDTIGKQCVDISSMMKGLRMVKSSAEVAKIKHACRIANQAFANLPSYATTGMTEYAICKQFQIDMLRLGMDECPYVVSDSGPDGYECIVALPKERVIEDGDVFIIDTGSKWDGYYCDFDRNWAFSHASDATKRAYALTYQATSQGFQAAQVGATMSDIYHAMWSVLSDVALGNDVGRMGHGLGMELTEKPSITPTDHSPLKAGMVITLEPGMVYAPNRSMVHEENIVITDSGPQWLTQRAPAELEIIA